MMQKATYDERTIYVDYMRVEPDNDTRGEYIGSAFAVITDDRGNYEVVPADKSEQFEDEGWTQQASEPHAYTVTRRTYRAINPQTAKWIMIAYRYDNGFVKYGENSMSYHGFDWDDVKSIRGLTYSFKDELKRMGFKFNKHIRGWVR